MHRVINQHPQIELPPIKEIRYLQTLGRKNKHSFFNRLFDSTDPFDRDRKLVKKKLSNWIRHPKSLRDQKWYLNYFFRKRNLAWYSNLFSIDKISGDMSPTYVFINEKQIQKIKESFPDLKIIIILREPISRYWSALKMNLVKANNFRLDEVSRKKIILWTEHRIAVTPSYLDCTVLWKKYFDQVLIKFYDELMENSEEFFNDIYQFLGCYNIGMKPTLNKKVNIGLKGEAPEYFKKALLQKSLEDIEKCNAIYPSEYFERWLELYRNEFI